jgi:hypothetical protein
MGKARTGRKARKGRKDRKGRSYLNPQAEPEASKPTLSATQIGLDISI